MNQELGFEMLSLLRPANVRNYLSKNEWVLAHERTGPGNWELWSRGSSDRVWFMSDASSQEYDLRLAVLIRDLAILEERPSPMMQVYADLIKLVN